MKLRKIEYVQLTEKDLKKIDKAKFPHMFDVAIKVRKGKPILVLEKKVPKTSRYPGQEEKEVEEADDS